MHDITKISQDGLPSSASLIKATLGAAILGTALLVTTVLPAEYGIDPTGVGNALGLTALNGTANTAAAPAETASGAVAVNDTNPVRKRDQAFQTRTFTLTLAPGQGTEVKAIMEAGERFVFSWQAEGGLVNFDMHGEPPNAAKDEFTSYWFARKQPGASGSFTAPFKGTHGWYWRNRSDKPVKVTVSLSGFFRNVFMP